MNPNDRTPILGGTVRVGKLDEHGNPTGEWHTIPAKSISITKTVDPLEEENDNLKEMLQAQRARIADQALALKKMSDMAELLEKLSRIAEGNSMSQEELALYQKTMREIVEAIREFGSYA